MNALVFVIIVLWLVVLGLIVTLLALARQVGILFERISPMGALVNESGPRIGDPSPRFQLRSLTGGDVTIGPSAGHSTLVFFLSPTCPVCKKLLPILKSVRLAERGWLDIVLASDGEAALQHRFVETADLRAFAYVVSTELGLAYRVARLPFAVLIDAEGIVRAKGLVNNREQLESLFNARDLGVASIQGYLDGAAAAGA